MADVAHSLAASLESLAALRALLLNAQPADPAVAQARFGELL
jgi:hypothetical protein